MLFGGFRTKEENRQNNTAERMCEGSGLQRRSSCEGMCSVWKRISDARLKVWWMRWEEEENEGQGEEGPCSYR